MTYRIRDELARWRTPGQIRVPTEPWTLMDANLWQGSALQRPTCFDMVFTLSHTAKMISPVGERVNEHHWPFADSPYYLPSETTLEQVAQMVNEHVADGQKVLVRCRAGLNRSGLVVATALCLQGQDVNTVVEHLRRQRSEHVLHNPAFLSWLGERFGGLTAEQIKAGNYPTDNEVHDVQ